MRSVSFVLGFSVVFIVLGLVLSQAVSMIGGASRTITMVAGGAVILLGFNVAFDFLKVLNLELRFHSGKRPAGMVSAFFFGAAFAAGWSPCVGPMLASILFLAGSGSSVNAAILLGLYSLGLALPFLLAGAFFVHLEGTLTFFKKHLREVKFASGALLVLIGVSMLLGSFSALNGTLSRWAYALDELSGTGALIARVLFTSIYVAVAVLAGLSALRGGMIRDRDASSKARNARPMYLRAIALVVAVGTLTLAFLEASGILNSAEILSAWFLFQGI